MIDKELEKLISPDLASRDDISGYKAEKQMAHYLERKFFDHPEIHVVNNLRFKCLTSDNDYAQIDHLIITSYCFIVVETKNWTGGIKYDEDANCWYVSKMDDAWHPCKESPIYQAKIQSEALRKVLQNNRETLRWKFLFMQGGFENYPVHYLVALYGEANVIKPDKPCQYDEMVLKAEAIPDKILEIYNNRKNSDTVKRFIKDAILDTDPVWILPKEDIEKTITFLKDIHRPRYLYRTLPLETVNCKNCGKPYSFEKNKAKKVWETICKSCGVVKPFTFKCNGCKQQLKIAEIGSSWPKKQIAFCKFCDEYRLIKD